MALVNSDQVGVWHVASTEGDVEVKLGVVVGLGLLVDQALLAAAVGS